MDPALAKKTHKHSSKCNHNGSFIPAKYLPPATASQDVEEKKDATPEIIIITNDLPQTNTLNQALLAPAIQDLHSKGDIITLAGAFAEFIQTLIGTFLTFAPTIDNVFGFKKNTPIGSLPVTLIIGTLSLWVAWETADAHRLVNKRNQTDFQHYNHNSTLAMSTYEKWRRKIKLTGDRIGHTGEYSGVLNAFFILLCARYLNRWITLAGSLVLIAIGYRMSFSDARTCKHAHHHEEENQSAPQQLEHVCSDTEHQHKTHHTDSETIIGLCGSGARTYFVTLVSLAMFLDSMANIPSNTPLDISMTNLISSAILSTLVTYCFVQCEKILNTQYQNHGNPETLNQALNDSKTLPSRIQKITLGGSSIALAINFSATIISLLLEESDLHRELFIGLNIGLSTLGGLLTSAYVRTYYTQIRHANFFVLQIPEETSKSNSLFCC